MGSDYLAESRKKDFCSASPFLRFYSSLTSGAHGRTDDPSCLQPSEQTAQQGAEPTAGYSTPALDAGPVKSELFTNDSPATAFKHALLKQARQELRAFYRFRRESGAAQVRQNQPSNEAVEAKSGTKAGHSARARKNASTKGR